MHFASVQCHLPGLLRNRLSAPTANAISGLEVIAVYMSAPMRLAYGTFAMSLISSFMVGQSSCVSHMPDKRGVVDGFMSCRLKCFSSWSIYACCKSLIVLDFLSQITSIPRRNFTLPRSFTLKCLERSSFILERLDFEFETISMLSTWTARMTNVFSDQYE